LRRLLSDCSFGPIRTVLDGAITQELEAMLHRGAASPPQETVHTEPDLRGPSVHGTRIADART
jgi:hypothetical protein